MKRILVASVALVCLAAVFAQRAVPELEQDSNHKKAPQMFKSIIHVNFSDSERQNHGLKNIANMLKEVKEPFEIEVVCHGSGITMSKLTNEQRDKIKRS